MIIPDAEREKGGINSHPMIRNFGPNIARNNTYTSNTYSNASSRNRDHDYGSGTPRRNSSPAQSNYNRYSHSSFANSEGSWQSSDEGEQTPPPAYSPLDPSFSREYVRPPSDQPRSNNRSSYHAPSSQGRYHRSTPGYSTPSPGPSSSASSSVGAPPPGVKAIGHVAIHETNGSIKGAYIIDPDKTMESSGRAELTTSNGAIDVDLAVLPPSTRTGVPSRKTANLVLESSCGSIKLRLHDAPGDMVARDNNRASMQRNMTVRARSSNGNVHICIPRSYHGMLTANTLNGRMKLSEGILENMTTVNGRGSEKVMFIGSTEGLPPIPAQTRDEEWDDGAGEGDNVSSFFVRGNGIRASTFPQGGGFFQGASNVTVVGGTFNTFPGDAHVFYNKSSGMSNSRRTQRRPMTTTEFELRWDGSRVDTFSANGNIQIAYDDEDAFGASGAWKSDVYNSDSRRARSGGYNNFVLTGDWTAWTGIMGAIF